MWAVWMILGAITLYLGQKLFPSIGKWIDSWGKKQIIGSEDDEKV